MHITAADQDLRSCWTDL